MVVLKRLADAERDGDRVLAVVRGRRDRPGRHAPSASCRPTVTRRRTCSVGRARPRGIDPASVGLRRGARNRHAHRRSHRGGCAGRRVRRRPPERRAVPHRVGQAQRRSPRGRRGRRRPHQGRARPAPRGDSADGRAASADPRGGLGEQRAAGSHRRSNRGPRRRRPAPSGGVQLRIRRHHRPPPARGGSRPRRRRPRLSDMHAASSSRCRRAPSAGSPPRPRHWPTTCERSTCPSSEVAATMWARRGHEPVRAAVVARHPHEVIARPGRVGRGESHHQSRHRLGAGRCRAATRSGCSPVTARTGSAWAAS